MSKTESILERFRSLILKMDERLSRYEALGPVEELEERLKPIEEKMDPVSNPELVSQYKTMWKRRLFRKEG